MSCLSLRAAALELLAGSGDSEELSSASTNLSLYGKEERRMLKGG